MQNRKQPINENKLEISESPTVEFTFAGFHQSEKSKLLIHWQEQGEFFTCTVGAKQDPNILVVELIKRKLEEAKKYFTPEEVNKLQNYIDAIKVEGKQVTAHHELLQNLFIKKEVVHRKRKKPETESGMEQQEDKKQKTSVENKSSITPQIEITQPADCPAALWAFVVVFKKDFDSILIYQSRTSLGASEVENYLSNGTAIQQLTHPQPLTFYCSPQLAQAWYQLYDLLPQNHNIQKINQPAESAHHHSTILSIQDYAQLEKVLFKVIQTYPTIAKIMHDILKGAYKHRGGIEYLVRDRINAEMIKISNQSVLEKLAENNNNIIDYYKQNNRFLQFSAPKMNVEEKNDSAFGQTLLAFSRNIENLKQSMNNLLSYAIEPNAIQIEGNYGFLNDLEYHLRHLEPKKTWGDFKYILHKGEVSRLEIQHDNPELIKQMEKLLGQADVIESNNASISFETEKPVVFR